MSDFRDELIEAMAQASLKHQREVERGGLFGEVVLSVACACGERFDTVAEHKHHKLCVMLDAALAHRSTVECPTCWGRVNDIAPGAKCKNPGCIDGRVPLETRLAIVEPSIGHWVGSELPRLFLLASSPDKQNAVSLDELDETTSTVGVSSSDLPEGTQT